MAKTKKKAKAKPDPLLTPEQAAEVAGMSRQAFLLHVGKDIQPDDFVGKARRAVFRRSQVLRWRRQRERAGVNKRGPQPRAAGLSAAT